MAERTNEEWLRSLGGTAADGVAVAELREPLRRGRGRALAGRAAADDGFIKDMAQEGAVKVLGGLATFRGDSRFTTWAVSVAVRVAFTELRRARWRDVSLDQLVADAPARGPAARPDGVASTEARQSVLAEMHRVIATGLTAKQRRALVAECCVALADWVAPKPSSVGHDGAAVAPISALTAWQGLIDRCRITAGQRVLIHGGTGAVGAFAVQLAKWRGARVIATASAHNLDHARSLGADEVIDYRATRFEGVVRDVDAVFDTVGGDTLARSWGVLKPGGKLVTVAASGEVDPDERTSQAFFIVDANRTQLVEVARLIDAGAIRPDVDGTFPLSDARSAYGHKPRRGKGVLRVVLLPLPSRMCQHGVAR